MENLKVCLSNNNPDLLREFGRALQEEGITEFTFTNHEKSTGATLTKDQLDTLNNEFQSSALVPR